MTDTVNIANGIPGSGKTQSFIDATDGSENILLVLPTKVLTKDIAKRLKDEGIEAYIINSDYYPSKVKESVEEALTELKHQESGCVVIITHQTLTNIDPKTLESWKVVVDEVPVISNTHQKGIGANLFKDLFDHLITWDEEGNVGIQEGKAHEIRVRKAEAGIDKAMSVQSLVFGALLKPKAEVSIDIKEEGYSVKYYVKVIDHHDYKSIIENSKPASFIRAQNERVESIDCRYRPASTSCGRLV
ncbi:DEAD/DEAH box helicase family protein, partial [Halomonas saccharevitans]